MVDSLFNLQHDNSDRAIRLEQPIRFSVTECNRTVYSVGVFLFLQVSPVIAIFRSLGRA